MTAKEANSKATKLFNRFKREFNGGLEAEAPTDEYYKKLNDFKKECAQLHNVVGVYKVLTDKNALRMASICSTHRFVQPFQMLMELQKTTGTY
jgi:hypothetical protein